MTHLPETDPQPWRRSRHFANLFILMRRLGAGAALGLHGEFKGPERARPMLIGNRLAVDFANTIAPVSSGGSLQSWGDLVDFLAAAGVVSQPPRDALKGLATTAPEATAAAFRAALELRASLQNSLAAIAAGRSAPPECVHPINTLLRWTEGYDQLAPSASGEHVPRLVDCGGCRLGSPYATCSC